VINAMSLKARAKNIAEKNNVDMQEVMQRYMFERILERISVSKYNDNFILKGGFLLSAMMGIDNRTTKDMDTGIKGISANKEVILNILYEILSIDLSDGVTFDIIKVTDILLDDDNGGNRYVLKAYLENMKINLSIDVSAGDVITPKELKYTYHLLFEDRKIIILSYNYETIIAEKLQTILSRGQDNSRMKDFYDLYFCINKAKEKLNESLLKKAIYNTFRNRDSIELLNDYDVILKEFIDYEIFNDRWNTYQKKHNYLKNISFNDVVIDLIAFIDSLNYQKTIL